MPSENVMNKNKLHDKCKKNLVQILGAHLQILILLRPLMALARGTAILQEVPGLVLR